MIFTCNAKKYLLVRFKIIYITEYYSNIPNVKNKYVIRASLEVVVCSQQLLFNRSLEAIEAGKPLKGEIKKKDVKYANNTDWRKTPSKLPSLECFLIHSLQFVHVI